MAKKIVAALFVLALVASGGIASAGEDGHSLEQLVVEMAETPAQHMALATHYRAKAEEARQERERHEQMGATYGGGKHVQRAHMKRHCQNISDRYAELAEEYDALAKLHEAEAKKP